MEHHCVGCNITIVANFKSKFAKVDGKTRIKLKCVVPAPISHTWKPNRKNVEKICVLLKNRRPCRFSGNVFLSSMKMNHYLGKPPSDPHFLWRESFHEIPPLLQLDRCAPTTGAADGLVQANLPTHLTSIFGRHRALNLACSSQK